MTTPLATVIVTQRERFGMTQESLESLYSETEGQFDVIVVDGGSPKATQSYLAEQAQARGFNLIRHPEFLTPNEARNIGCAAAKTKYVAFVDNDVLYTPGWLQALVRCAEETGAAAVAPLTCQGLPAHQEIHHAGGDFVDGSQSMQSFFDVKAPAKRKFVEVMRGHGEPLDSWEDSLERTETGFTEFHCVLARRDVFDKIGPLDEKMLSTKEHIDFGMSLRAAGETVWFEPASVVTYVFPCRARPLEVADWPFFCLRWSDTHAKKSLNHFIQKWRLETESDYVRNREAVWPMRRRQGVLIPLVRRVPLVGGNRTLTNKIAGALARLEKPLNRLYVRMADKRIGRTA
ncbi:glycosyltransferase [uncultured Roseobacter sp.]|uniref:glycosyltransferase family 2 protein n=1 Tax=uncultured Roseobacter sp. TaxID=114847 RepID=UPI002623A559|nr:glycosyltransferase [uncultured Roseobacter sp.]